MLNQNCFLVYDFETGERNPYTCQAIQLACVAVEPRNLQIIPNSEFESLIKPIFDAEECEKCEVDPLAQQALDVNKKTIAELKEAPIEKVVWNNFQNYVMNFNPSGKDFTCPILVGFNNHGFDDIILNRMAKKYGPWDESRQNCKLFNKYWNLDIMEMLFPWFESSYDPRTISMKNVMEFLGIDPEGAHDALQDVKNEALIFIQLMKLSRKYSKITRWKK